MSPERYAALRTCAPVRLVGGEPCEHWHWAEHPGSAVDVAFSGHTTYECRSCHAVLQGAEEAA